VENPSTPRPTGGHQKNTKTYQEIDTGDVEEVRAVKGNSEGRGDCRHQRSPCRVRCRCLHVHCPQLLDHQPKFTITNTISSSSTTQTPALLYPGVSRYLWYTAHNPLTVPITVTTMSISSVTAPAGCPIVNLSYAATTFTGSLVVPAQGSNSVPVPISLFETHKNQDSCENTTFRFDFQGTATFNVVPSTSTLLSSSHNPSVVGQSVTYTATVVSGDGSGNHHNSNSPTGTVTFKDGSITICSNVQSLGTPTDRPQQPAHPRPTS